MPAPSRSALVIAFTTIYLVWGSTYLGIRVAMESIPLFAMAGARFTLAGALLLIWVRWRGAPAPTARQWAINGIVGLFLLLGGNGLVVWAEQFIPTGITALLVGVSPLFIVLTEWAWPGGIRPSAATAGALLVGFFGVAWLAAPWESDAHGGLYIPGLIALLTACLLWSIGLIYSRHAKHGAYPLVASSLQMLTGGAALLVTATLHGDFVRLDLAQITAHSWAAFIYLVLIGSLVGFSTFVWLMKKCAPAQVATYAYVNPVVAVFLGWLLHHEPINSRTLVAAAIIVAAVAMITIQKNSAAKSKSA